MITKEKYLEYFIRGLTEASDYDPEETFTSKEITDYHEKFTTSWKEMNEENENTK